MDLHRRVLVVIEPAPFQEAVVEVEAEWLDEVELAAGVRTQPDDRTGVRRDLRMDEDDMRHLRKVST